MVRYVYWYLGEGGSILVAEEGMTGAVETSPTLKPALNLRRKDFPLQIPRMSPHNHFLFSHTVLYRFFL
jgi:hypothetical protein